MRHCKRWVMEGLAVLGLVFSGSAAADFNGYHQSVLDGPSSSTSGDYYLDWYVIPVDYMAQNDVIQIAYLETRLNGAGTWQQVQQWDNVPLYAAYDSVQITGQGVGTHNYHMLYLIYSPYFGYQFLEDYWDVAVTAPPPPPTPGITTPPAEVTSGLAAGTTPYGLDVATNGDAAVNIPLDLIPGVAGFKPELSLTYSSGRGVERMARRLPEDTIGYGWRVQGFSQIRRCIAGQSGAASIQLNNNDSLCLDDMPLVLVSGAHFSPGALYRTQIESYSRIEIKGSSSALWFEVTTADGTVLEYGNDTGNGSRVDRGGGVDFQWSLNKATSADKAAGGDGNVIVYTYHHNPDKGINYPLSIDYDNAHVNFGYALRTDADAVDIASGTSQEQVVSLHTITVLMNTAKVREYRLFHEDVGGNHRLRKLQQCGYDTSGTAASCFKPLLFNWDTPSPTMAGVEIYLTGLTDGLAASQVFVYGTVIQGQSPSFILANGDTPFGTPTAPTGTAALSGSNGAALRHVVTQLQRDNGIGGWHATNYAYLGVGLTSTDNWGFLGFFAQRIHDAVSGVYTYAQYRQDYPFFGRLARLYQYDGPYGSSAVLTKAETSYESIATATGIVSPYTQVLYPYASQAANLLYENNTLLGITHSATALTASSGFITQAVTTTTSATSYGTSGGSGVWGSVPVYSFSTGVKRTVATTASFSNGTSPWLIGFTQELTTESWSGPVSGAGIKQKVVYLAKSGTLRVAEFTRFPDDLALKVRTINTIDGRGRVTATSTEGTVVTEDNPSGTLVTRTSTAGSFSAERYPAQIINPLNQTTNLGSCDLRFGQHCSMLSPNGEQLSNLRDPFGRVVSATDADGVVTSTSYVLDGSTVIEGATAAYRVDSDSITTPATRTYYDKLGRVIRAQTQSFASASVYTTQDTKYDALGRITKLSVPYPSTGSAPAYTEYAYDIRNRITGVTYPQGSGTASTTTAYTASSNQIVETITEGVKNSTGASTVQTQVKQNTYDILGQLVKTIDAYGTTQASTVEFGYNANGLMTSSVVNGTVTTLMQYDAAGNRTQLADPDAGTTNTTYTPFGEVRTVTDAASQLTSFTYDKLGRLTQRVNADGTSAWAWDTATNGVGKLASRSTGTGFTETYSYNANKKLSSVVTSIIPIGGSTATNFTTSFTYDSYGRPLGTTYPSNFYVSRYYNSQGYLYQIKNGSTVLQTFNSVDSYGTPTQETYGNGVITTRQTDPKTGRLLGIDTKIGSVWIQENDYAWQSNGILESRVSKSNTAIRTETFGHDLHNRLESAVSTNNFGMPSRTLAYEYDATGNMQEQTTTVSADPDVEDYTYGSSRPHAVTHAMVGGVPVDLTYDANGAITKYDIYATSVDKYIEYNATHQPTKIVLGASLTDPVPQARDEFRYDTDGNRVYKRSVWQDGGVTRQENIYYVGGCEVASYVNDPANVVMVYKTRIGKNIMHVIAINNTSQFIEDIEYAHRDHLGSIEKVSNQTGGVLRTLAYEPFGVRKASTWQNNITPAELSGLLTQQFVYMDYPPDVSIRIVSPMEARGFTGHEHLDRTGFIHMNGRVYDPMLGRFLSPDPIVQSSTNSQSWNRYSYAFNSPLSWVDPSGYDPVPPTPGMPDAPPLDGPDLVDTHGERLKGYRDQDCWGYGIPMHSIDDVSFFGYASYVDEYGSCHNTSEGYTPNYGPPGGGSGYSGPNLVALTNANLDLSADGKSCAERNKAQNCAIGCGQLAADSGNKFATTAALTVTGAQFGPWGALGGFIAGVAVSAFGDGFSSSSQSSAIDGMGAVIAERGNPAAFFGAQAENAFRRAFKNAPGIGIIGGAAFGSLVQNAIVRGSVGAASALRFGALAGTAYLGTYITVFGYTFRNCMAGCMRQR